MKVVAIAIAAAAATTARMPDTNIHTNSSTNVNTTCWHDDYDK